MYHSYYYLLYTKLWLIISAIILRIELNYILGIQCLIIMIKLLPPDRNTDESKETKSSIFNNSDISNVNYF